MMALQSSLTGEPQASEPLGVCLGGVRYLSRVLSTKPDNLNLIPQNPHGRRRSPTLQVVSYLRRHAAACVHMHTHKIKKCF